MSLAAGLAAAVTGRGTAKACLGPSPRFLGMRIATFWRRGRLGRLLAEDRPDLIHAQFGHLGLLALPVAKALRIPLVVSFRGQDVMLLRKAAPAHRDALFRCAARILARSEDMRTDLLAIGCPAEKLFVHHSGIDVSSIPFRERRPPEPDGKAVVCIAGRLVPKKGIEEALRALARCRFAPAARILGDGPERARLRRLISELGLDRRVTMTGLRPRHEVIREMLHAHVFLLPCRTGPDGEKEGIPNAIKEAQATGLPVVSTRHAGIAECVEHGGSGLLVPEGDVGAVAASLDELISHPERWPEMGRRGRELVDARFDVRKLAPALARHYQAALPRLQRPTAPSTQSA